MSIKFETLNAPSYSEPSGLAQTGYIALFNLNRGVVPPHIVETDGAAVFPLTVAANVIFGPHEQIVVNGVTHKTVHYAAHRHPRSSRPFRPELMHPPVFAVTVSETVQSHPQGKEARELILNLQTITSPWVGMQGISRGILEKAGILGLPPVIVVVASEADFNNELSEGFSHGRWISIVEPGTRLGLLKNGRDLLFEIVWGSNVWPKGFATADSSHTFFEVQHEVSHLLILVALVGKIENMPSQNNTSITQVLGRPIWEGLADCISGRLQTIGNDELFRNMNIGFNPKINLIDQLQSRSVGNATSYMNELFTSLLLRAWQCNGKLDDIESVSPMQATLACINALSGRRKEVPENAENGWLVKRIFSESNFDWKKFIIQLKAMTQEQVESIIGALLPYDIQQDIRSRLVQECMQAAPYWDPFGEDSIK